MTTARIAAGPARRDNPQGLIKTGTVAAHNACSTAE